METSPTVSTRETSGQRQSSPPTFENRRRPERASLPPRPHGSARHAKRLTLNFPINIGQIDSQIQLENDSPATSTMSPMTQTSRVSSPTRISSVSPDPDDAANDSSGFLVALAAQERKVLELREELARAEAELTTLKRQWATGERGRKKTELIHHAEAMKPLKHTPQNSVDGSNTEKTSQSDVASVPSQARLSRESERRKSLKQLASSSPVGDSSNTSVSSRGRTVFKNSKHTRTLSLLSPELSTGFKPSFPQPDNVNDDAKRSDGARSPQHPRSSTLPSVERSESSSSVNSVPTSTRGERTQWRNSLPPISHDVSPDVLMKTGRQMASDFREGLWTFFEDIRQATVGDEAINGTESRSMQSSQSTTRPARRNGAGNVVTSRDRSTTATEGGRSTMSKDNASTTSGNTSKPTPRDVSFWSEFGIDAPDQTAIPINSGAAATQSQQKDADELDFPAVEDNWDVWDTPKSKTHTPSSSSSTFPSKRDQSPSTAASSPRTSTRLVTPHVNL